MYFKLVIVTVTYKLNDDLLSFIESYNKFNDLGDNVRLIVVDNSPIDYRNVESLIKSFSNIDYISLPQNPGFGAANNIGFDLYKSDFVLFINNDVEFLEPVFKKLIKIHEKEPNLGCIGIHQEGGGPSYFKKMTAPIKIEEKSFSDKYHFVSGAFMFFKSHIFNEIGKFDSNLFMYCEEQDLSKRLNDNFYYTCYLPNLRFLHKIGNRKKPSEKSWELLTISFCYFCKKHNINPIFAHKGVTNRILKLRIYFFLKLNFKEVLKLTRSYKKRKKIIYEEFGIEI